MSNEERDCTRLNENPWPAHFGGPTIDLSLAIGGVLRESAGSTAVHVAPQEGMTVTATASCRTRESS